MRKRSSICKWIGCCRLTQCICLTKTVRNCIAMHAIRLERGKRRRRGYVHAETTFVFIYVSKSLSSLLRVLRGNQSTLTRLFNARHPTDTREADFTLLRLPCDCSALAPHRSDLCIHLYGLGPIRLLSRFNGTKRGVALFISFVFRVFRDCSIFVLSLSH